MLLRIVASVILPPLGAFLAVGLTGQFLLNILLTVLGYLPGVIHAVWLNVREG
jgi:uncharacterized membrane protein YqaE (UPF0057 family)